MFIVGNPYPLIWSVEGTGGAAFFGAEIQFEKVQKVNRDLKVVDRDIVITSFTTDNENTMKSVRSKVRRTGVVANGCGSHSVNKAMGLFTFSVDHIQ